ncbi:hypothetical protein ACRAWD_08465 [Caulobacter segnis]
MMAGERHVAVAVGRDYADVTLTRGLQGRCGKPAGGGCDRAPAPARPWPSPSSCGWPAPASSRRASPPGRGPEAGIAPAATTEQ